MRDIKILLTKTLQLLMVFIITSIMQLILEALIFKQSAFTCGVFIGNTMKDKCFQKNRGNTALDGGFLPFSKTTLNRYNPKINSSGSIAHWSKKA